MTICKYTQEEKGETNRCGLMCNVRTQAVRHGNNGGAGRASAYLERHSTAHRSARRAENRCLQRGKRRELSTGDSTYITKYPQFFTYYVYGICNISKFEEVANSTTRMRSTHMFPQRLEGLRNTCFGRLSQPFGVVLEMPPCLQSVWEIEPY